MERFGFNLNLTYEPDEILRLGEDLLEPALFHGIEFTYYENMQDVNTFGYMGAIQDLVKRYQPQVLSHVPGFNTSEESSVIRAAILHEVINTMKLVRDLGGHEIVLHSGQMRGFNHVPIKRNQKGFVNSAQKDENAVYEKCFDLSVKFFRMLMPIAEEYGMTVYTENLNWDHTTVTSEQVIQFVKAVDSKNLKVVFDIGHCHHTGHQIVPELEAYGDLLGHLHLHDNFGEKDEHLLLGAGNIDYAAFGQTISKMHYQGLYLMEVRKTDAEGLKQCREKLLASL